MIWQKFAPKNMYVGNERQNPGPYLAYYTGATAAPVYWCTVKFGGFFVQDAGMLCFDSFSFMIGIDTFSVEMLGQAAWSRDHDN